MKKTLTAVIAALLIAALGIIPAFAELNPEDVPDDAVFYKLDMDNYSVCLDFESAFPQNNYTGALGDLGIEGISYICPTSYVNILTGEEALSGEQSFVAKGYLDARIWSLTLLEGEGDYVFVECKFKPICMDGTGYFTLNYEEPDTAGTSTEGSGGWIFKVIKKGDKIVVNNRGGKAMAELEEGKTYTLAAAFPVGEKTYDFFVDGVRVAEKNKWVGEVNGLSGFRIDMGGPGPDAIEANAANTLSWAMDDLIITYGEEITKEQYFATPTPTPEPTPEPTATPEATAAPETTKAPSGGNDSGNKTEDGGKKGCGGVIVSSAIVASMTLLAAAVVLKKKH